MRGFEKVSYSDKDIKLPIRATRGSSGYDFYATEDLVIPPGEKVFFLTDVKAYMQQDECLLIDIRSSIGHEKDLILTTTIGNIDSDFYNNPKNEGNIGIGLRNLKKEFELVNMPKPIEASEDGEFLGIIPIIKDLRKENTVVIKAGERVAQGIFIKYLTIDNDKPKSEFRSGGYGSTSV